MLERIIAGSGGGMSGCVGNCQTGQAQHFYFGFLNHRKLLDLFLFSLHQHLLLRESTHTTRAAGVKPIFNCIKRINCRTKLLPLANIWWSILVRLACLEPSLSGHGSIHIAERGSPSIVEYRSQLQGCGSSVIQGSPESSPDVSGPLCDFRWRQSQIPT